MMLLHLFEREDVCNPVSIVVDSETCEIAFFVGGRAARVAVNRDRAFGVANVL